MNNDASTASDLDRIFRKPHLWAVGSGSTIDKDLGRFSDLEASRFVMRNSDIADDFNRNGYILSGGSGILDETPEIETKTSDVVYINRWAVDIKRAVDAGDIKGARSLLSRLTPTEIQRYRLSAWKELLDIPKPMSGDAGGGTPLGKLVSVICPDNLDKYRGKWVALGNDGVLGSNRSKLALYRALKAENKLLDATFMYIGA